MAAHLDRDDLRVVVEAALDAYYGPDSNWRSDLNGEGLLLDAWVSPGEAQIMSVRYLADGVRQVAAPRAFDALRCARAIKVAIDPGSLR